MSSGNFDLTTYYAKRIIGDAAAATATNALLQTGDGITSNIWILHRTNRTTEKYGIHYAYDGTNGHDKIEFYGKGANDDATAWVQLDTGDASFNNINSYGTITTTTLFLKNTTTDLTQSNNGSDNTIYHSIWGADKNNKTWFCVEGYTNSSGSVAAFLGVRNYNTSGTAQSWKGFTITEDKSNNLTYTVSDPHAFRSAISTWALVSDSYNTFMPADGTTNGWYKFGTSNTSYGILPSASGGAGSGHNYIGTSTWYWKYSHIDEMYGRNLTISGNNNGIYFTGTAATQQMIKFIDANDAYGSGISIGGGGLTILGSGESANTLFSNLSVSGAAETTYIAADNSIEFYPSQNGYDASARIWMTASVLNIGVDGNTTRESSVNVYSGAGRIQLYSAASATGNRGIWVAAHGTGAAKTVITVDTNNNVTLNGNAATATCVIHPDASVSYVAGAKGTDAAVFAKKAYNQDHWYPAVSLQTKGGGAWQIGNYNDETLEFVYFPKDKIDSSTNSGQTEVYITSAGVFSGSISGNAATATRINGNLTAATSDVNRNIWVSSGAGADGIPNYVSGFHFNPSTSILSVPGLIKSTCNGNTVTIGSQNANYCHIYNSANVPFIFNKAIHAIGNANLGNASYPWGNLYIGGANNGIYFVGTKQTYRMIRFIDNTAGADGNGIVIGGGGLAMLGSGESVDTLFNNVGASGGTETTYIGSDGTIEFLPTQQNGYDVSAHFTMTDGRFWAGVNGNTTRETSVGAQSGAGQIYMWSHAATSGSRGIYVPAHGTGAAKTVLGVDTNNNVTFYGSLNGKAWAADYLQSPSYGSGSGESIVGALQKFFPDAPKGVGTACIINQGSRAVAFGYFLGGTSYNTVSTAYGSWFVGAYGTPRFVGVSNGTWTDSVLLHSNNYSSYAVAKTGSTMSGTLAIVNNTQDNASYNALLYVEHKSNNDWGLVINKSTSYDYGISVTCKSDGSNGVKVTGRITGTTVYGAVWNDYAEYRQGAVTEGGYCVHESPDGTMRKSTERLEAGCRITSDTFGFAIGETEKCKTPIAVSGRVLVYPYRAREEYPLGAAVCSAPGGTVDIMTRDEIMLYPERIVGTVSEIPTYEIWESGQGKNDTPNHRPVNGRIWIYVR